MATASSRVDECARESLTSNYERVLEDEIEELMAVTPVRRGTVS